VSVLDDVTAELARLPGIGRKTATRLAYFLLRQPKGAIERLTGALQELDTRVAPCTVCGAWSEVSPCEICQDPRRDAGLVCVVEEPSDIAAVERAGEYRGVYHVLGGHLSPLDGVGPGDLRITELGARVANGAGVREVILATNPSMEGEVTATYVRGVLEPLGVKVTRIALGLPVGGDLEYADGLTIARALAARREMGG